MADYDPQGLFFRTSLLLHCTYLIQHGYDATITHDIRTTCIYQPDRYL